MRRLTLALGALLALAAAGGLNGIPDAEARVSCSDYCGEKAAGWCDDIDSWKCGFYIAGCLTGCGVSTLVR